MTADEQYALLNEQQFNAFIEESFSKDSLKGVQLYEVTLKNGLKIKCRKLDARYAAVGQGQTPMVLSSMIITGEKNTPQTPAEKEAAQATAWNAMSADEQAAQLEIAMKMARYVCVSPRLIKGDLNGHGDAISLSRLTADDFAILTAFAGGGQDAQALKTFRGKRR